MATPEYYTGDTWPPLTGTAKTNGTAVNLSYADSMRMIAKGAASLDIIAGTATFCTVPNGGLGDGTDGKAQYLWAADDLTVADTYTPELEVTWDAISSPPKIETFRLGTFLVLADND